MRIRVPVKLEHPKASDAETAGFVSFSNKTDATLSVNGESVNAYKIGRNNSQGTITVKGDIANLMNALPAGFYVSFFEGQSTAMTVTNIDLEIRNDDGSYTHFSEYSALDAAVREQLKQDNDQVSFKGGLTGHVYDLTDTAVELVLNSLASGIPRDASTSITNLKPIGLTEFIHPSTITFKRIIDNGANEGEALLFLDESPIHKQIGPDAINNLFENKFPGATFEGLKDICNGRETDVAKATSETLYNVLKTQFCYDKSGNLRTIYLSKDKNIFIGNVTIKVYVELKAILDAFFTDAASLRAFLPKLRIAMTIGTYPYADNYGEKGAPVTPTNAYYPLIFWGLDAEI